MNEIKKAIQTLEDCRDVAAVRLKSNSEKRTAIYVNLDTCSDFNQAITALGMQIPKKIIGTGFNEECPNCHCDTETRYGAEYCKWCGQKLDRGDE